MTDIQKPDMSKQWANSGNKTPPADSLINSGWVAGQIPLESDFNYIDARQDQGLAYILQKGVPEWDSSTEYQANKSYVQYGGKVYKCIQTGVNKQPNTQPSFWRDEQGISPSRTITSFDGTGVADGSLITFAGRDATGDGGGGPLRFLAGSTATANGVTVYAVPGGRLFRDVRGSVRLSAATSFAAAVATGLDVEVDVDATINTIVTSAAPGQVIRGAGGKLTINTATGRYRQIHAGAQCHGLDIVTTGGVYAITNEAPDTLTYNCAFTGPVGHYVLSVDAPRAGVLLCRTEGKGQVTPFVFQNCQDFKAALNELVDHTGFGIQARWCNGGSMTQNIVRNPLYKYSVTASNGQTSYTFTVPSGGHARWGFYIQDANGCIARLVTSITVSGTTATVVTSEPSVSGAGAVAVLVGCDALESYQINSGCKDVRIENNFSDGTGDSNVVVGADYHWTGTTWELNPGAVVASDEATGSIVSGNTLKNALYSNVAVNNSQQFVSVTGNHCYYAGYAADVNAVLDCNINCSAQGVIIGNSCHADAAIIRTRYGIASTPLQMANYSVGGQLVYAAANTFYGDFKEGHYQLAATSIATDRRIGLKVDGDYRSYEPMLVPILATTWATKPANDQYWIFFHAWAGWTRNTTEQIIGGQCVQTIGGSYVDCGPSFFKDMAEGGILKVNVKAKGTGYVTVFSNFVGGTTTAETIQFSGEANYITKELYMSVKSFTELFVRIGSDGSDVMYLQDVALEFLPLK